MSDDSDEAFPQGVLSTALQEKIQKALEAAFLGELMQLPITEQIRQAALGQLPEGSRVDAVMVGNAVHLRISPPQIQVTVTFDIIDGKEVLRDS